MNMRFALFLRPSVVRSALCLVGAALLASAAPSAVARAAVTHWQTSEGGRVRIAASAPSPDGTVRAAVVIDLKPGWTTYWRNPGESGIPPQLTTDGSVNVASAELDFPAPTVLDEAGLRVIGYDRSVALPLTIRQKRPGAATTLNAGLFIGVCKDICIPMKTDFRLPLAVAAAGGGQDVQVRLAYAGLPERESADFRLLSVKATGNGEALDVAVRMPEASASSDPVLFAAGPPQWSLGIARFTGRQGRTAHFSVPASGPEGKKIAGVTIKLVVTDGGRSIATSKQVE